MRFAPRLRSKEGTSTPRIVCTIEAENVDEEVRIFELVRRTSGVLDVSLIEHRIGESSED